jgi:hypothetical protein
VTNARSVELVAAPGAADTARESTRQGAKFVWLLGLLLAVPAAAIAATRGFDGLYGQDAYAYFDYGTTSVRQSILQLRPLEAFFWPPGYPLLVALVSLATGPVALAEQVVSLTMGALVPVFTALLARELWPEDRLLPFLAGALVAFSGQLWQSSVVVMADTTGLALATLGAWALVRYARSGRLRWLLVASAALAYATLARWIYGLVAIPFALYALWAISARPNPGGRAALHSLAAVAVAAGLLVPIFGPSLVGLLSHPSEPASFAGNLQVYSWSPLNALRRDFFTADGHLSYVLPNGVYYAVAPGNPAFFGPLLVVWLAVGAWVLLRESLRELQSLRVLRPRLVLHPRSRLAEQRGWRRAGSGGTGGLAALLLIAGWAGVVYAFHAGAPWQNFRFTLAYLPPLGIVVAVGLAWTSRRVDRRLGLALTLLVAVALLSSAANAVRLVGGFIDRKDDDLALVRWVEAETPPNARLFSFGPTLTFRHYGSLPTFDLFDLSPAEVSSILSTSAPTYLLLDEHSVEGQWLGQAPSINFHVLRDGPGLSQVGFQGSYKLYRVGSSDGVSEGSHFLSESVPIVSESVPILSGTLVAH